jgi:hypothetical protein
MIFEIMKNETYKTSFMSVESKRLFGAIKENNG